MAEFMAICGCFYAHPVHAALASHHLRARLAARVDRNHRDLRTDLPAALATLGIDPMLWGVLVFVNLQADFLSPPVAMSAFYLKGVSPAHVTINQIFAGMMPYMFFVVICMVLMYIWPQLTLWLLHYLYGGRG
jgi:Tripartite ATP-independent periplasmic transporter, DctM component